MRTNRVVLLSVVIALSAGVGAAQSANALLETIEQSLAARDYDDALMAFTDLLAVDETAAGRAYELVDRWIVRRPKEMEVYRTRAIMRDKGGRDLEALDDWEKVAELDAKNPEAHYLAGVMAYNILREQPQVTKGRAEVIRRGIAALERAEALKGNYFEALVYHHYILGYEAEMEDDRGRKAKLLAEAAALRERAMAIDKARKDAAAAEERAAEGDGARLDAQPLRVGGDVKAPYVLERVEPVVSEPLLKARISGIVILEALIDREGAVRDVKILKDVALGGGEAAAEAVRQWKFRPATLHGEPVDVLFNLTVRIPPEEP